MTRCTKCGQLIASAHDAEWLLDILTHGTPHRTVYHGRDGGWFVSYGGGEVSRTIVQNLVAQGLIASCYSDCPKEAYHVGRTWDVQRTLEARKKLGKAAPNIYVDLPTRHAEISTGHAVGNEFPNREPALPNSRHQ